MTALIVELMPPMHVDAGMNSSSSSSNEIQQVPPGKYFRDARRVAFLIDRPQEDL